MGAKLSFMASSGDKRCRSLGFGRGGLDGLRPRRPPSLRISSASGVNRGSGEVDFALEGSQRCVYIGVMEVRRVRAANNLRRGLRATGAGSRADNQIVRLILEDLPCERDPEALGCCVQITVSADRGVLTCLRDQSSSSRASLLGAIARMPSGME